MNVSARAVTTAFAYLCAGDKRVSAASVLVGSDHVGDGGRLQRLGHSHGRRPPKLGDPHTAAACPTRTIPVPSQRFMHACREDTGLPGGVSIERAQNNERLSGSELPEKWEACFHHEVGSRCSVRAEPVEGLAGRQPLPQSSQYHLIFLFQWSRQSGPPQLNRGGRVR